jgi:hypothetical protein
MRRGTWMWVALVATLVTTGWLAATEGDDAPVAVAAARSRPASAIPLTAKPVPPAPGAWPAPPGPRASEPWPFDPARTLAWVPPPPPPPPVAVAVPPLVGPVRPDAPPFPYTLIGRLQDGDKVQVLLTNPVRTLGVKLQDVIDGQWRVDAIDDAGLTVRWLPGGQQQTLVFRAS